jgi:hypothetical protein
MKAHQTPRMLGYSSFLFIILVFTSCSKDKTPDRNKFFGTYDVSENCDSGNYSFSITITESSSSANAIIINNFGNFNINIRATVSGSNISINDNKNGVDFVGNGSINGNTLSIEYTASAGGNGDNCTKICKKQ